MVLNQKNKKKYCGSRLEYASQSKFFQNLIVFVQKQIHSSRLWSSLPTISFIFPTSDPFFWNLISFIQKRICSSETRSISFKSDPFFYFLIRFFKIWSASSKNRLIRGENYWELCAGIFQAYHFIYWWCGKDK